MTPKGHRVIRGHCDLYFDPKVKVTFVVGLTPKGHGVIRGCRDLLHDPKGQLELWPWPKGQAFVLTEPTSNGDHVFYFNLVI